MEFCTNHNFKPCLLGFKLRSSKSWSNLDDELYKLFSDVIGINSKLQHTGEEFIYIISLFKYILHKTRKLSAL
jgi:hypothetical protein